MEYDLHSKKRKKGQLAACPLSIESSASVSALNHTARVTLATAASPLPFTACFVDLA